MQIIWKLQPHIHILKSTHARAHTLTHICTQALFSLNKENQKQTHGLLSTSMCQGFHQLVNLPSCHLRLPLVDDIIHKIDNE